MRIHPHFTSVTDICDICNIYIYICMYINKNVHIELKTLPSTYMSCLVTRRSGNIFLGTYTLENKLLHVRYVEQQRSQTCSSFCTTYADTATCHFIEPYHPARLLSLIVPLSSVNYPNCVNSHFPVNI